eukprot:TRINITY_DN54974_c0_g1_i1.p1 TRINITY_DN54974_c0_g1~~TRINITY_DN54974_c0_g1_i1.p1  ORF type:complete len:1660 (+),score=269.61 TRINITY_DN54974_c0_g1_i1:31-4980(+)
MDPFSRGQRSCVVTFVVVFAARAIAAVSDVSPSRGDGGGDGFDVRVDMRASWPQVPNSALEFEWAKRSRSPSEVASLLLGGEQSTFRGAGNGGASSLFIANRHDSPGVEAQRAACRILSGNEPPCGGAAFAAVYASSDPAMNLTRACGEAELEAALLRSSDRHTSVAHSTDKPFTSSGGAYIGQELAGDLPLVDETFGSTLPAAAVVLCGCVEDASLVPLLAWAARRTGKKTGWPLTAVYRQADCNAPPGGSTSVPREVLHGYAVELRIKSSEYKATDDAAGEESKKVEDVNARKESDAEDDEDDSDDDSRIDAAEALVGVEIAGLHLGVLAGRFPNLSQNLVTCRERLEAEGGTEEAALRRWELEDLSLKVAQRAVKSPNPFRTLAGITDNFPATMAGVARQTQVQPKLRRALKRLESLEDRAQKRMEMDGRQIGGAGDLTLFPILEQVEARITAAARLTAPADSASKSSLSSAASLVSPAVLARLQRSAETGNASFPNSSAWQSPTRLDWRSALLRWTYNVKSDEEAEDWPQRLSALASGGEEDTDVFGMYRSPSQKQRTPLQVQQPIFTMVFVFDPTDARSVDVALNLTGDTRAARVALVPAASGSASSAEPIVATARALANAYAWILKAGNKADTAAARGFLKALKTTPPSNPSEVDRLMQKHLPKPRRGSASAWAKVEASGAAANFEGYLQEKGLPIPSLVVNGRVAVSDSGNANSLMLGLQNTLDAEEKVLRAAVRAKRLRDGKKIKEGDVALERFLLEAEGDPANMFDAMLTPTLLAVAPAHARQRNQPGDSKASAEVASPTALLAEADLALLPTFGASSSAPGVNASMLLFLRRAEDVQLLAHFAEYLTRHGQDHVRLAVAAAPLEASSVACAQRFRAALTSAAAAATAPEQLDGLKQALSCCGIDVLAPAAKGADACTASVVDGGAGEARRAEERLWLALPRAARQAAMSDAGLSSNSHSRRGSAVAVCNGKVVLNVPTVHVAPALLLEHWCPPPLFGVPLVATAMAAFVIKRDPPSPLMRTCSSSMPKALRLRLAPRDRDAPVFTSLTGVVDPLGQDTAAFLQLAQVLNEELNADVCIALKPQEMDDYPLKRWQRRVLATSVTSEGVSASDAGVAVFARLRTQHTLTMHIISPLTWLVTAHESEHDLDNMRAVDAVRLAGRQSRPEIHASFLLSRLYLEGSAHVEGSGNAATGLQLELLPAGSETSSALSSVSSDTRVMQNHGFWSMPASPGPFELSLMPGASNDTFTLIGDASKPLAASSHLVEVTSFVLPFRPLRVAVRPGRKETDLVRKTIGRSRPRSSRRGRSRRSGNASGTGETSEVLPTIHIFSVASGHLYERLLAVMVHSVRNHTKCPLHVWIVSNFLSPGFTDTLPRLQNSLDGVTFDLVSFKWPSWLNPQEEKQRLIWAYKILFLDVLFPMDVPRVIFIDSDLVVRSDVRELWDMDLQGAPYAFTPFCSGSIQTPDGTNVSRKNPTTTGYRFWESGYWADHLGPKKSYHISALFVVDLLAFRRESVGDTLRSDYNSMTKSPGSLANLDQDLPNWAQTHIPIFSLPQEWLWCETWCSNASFPMAKAIDLCQNPSTKEPKTAMARRVIGEWDAYHTKVLALREVKGGRDSKNGSVNSSKSSQASTGKEHTEL